MEKLTPHKGFNLGNRIDRFVHEKKPGRLLPPIKTHRIEDFGDILVTQVDRSVPIQANMFVKTRDVSVSYIRSSAVYYYATFTAYTPSGRKIQYTPLYYTETQVYQAPQISVTNCNRTIVSMLKTYEELKEKIINPMDIQLKDTLVRVGVDGSFENEQLNELQQHYTPFDKSD